MAETTDKPLAGAHPDYRPDLVLAARSANAVSIDDQNEAARARWKCDPENPAFARAERAAKASRGGKRKGKGEPSAPTAVATSEGGEPAAG